MPVSAIRLPTDDARSERAPRLRDTSKARPENRIGHRLKIIGTRHRRRDNDIGSRQSSKACAAKLNTSSKGAANRSHHNGKRPVRTGPCRLNLVQRMKAAVRGPFQLTAEVRFKTRNAPAFDQTSTTARAVIAGRGRSIPQADDSDLGDGASRHSRIGRGSDLHPNHPTDLRDNICSSPRLIVSSAGRLIRSFSAIIAAIWNDGTATHLGVSARVPPPRMTIDGHNTF